MAHFGRGKTHAPIVRHGVFVPTFPVAATFSLPYEARTTYASLILAETALVSYWRLGEASGNALDSKDSNPGTVAGGVTRQAAGLLLGDADQAVRGDGVVGTSIAIPNSANQTTAAATVECWIKPTSLPGVDVSVVDKFLFSVWRLEYLGVGRWRWYVRTAGGGGDIVLDTATAPVGLKPAAGVLHHLVGTYSIADGGRLYVNGVQVASAASTGQNIISGGGPIRLLAADTTTSSFPGTLDEVALYNAVLTPQQVLDHYQLGMQGLVNVYGTFSLPYESAQGTFPVAAIFSSFPYEANVGVRHLDTGFAEADGTPTTPVVATIDLPYESSLPTYSDLIRSETSLVSYWRVDEASGNLLDSKGSNPATTVAGGFTRQATGLLSGDTDTALQGDGVIGTFASVPDSASLRPAAMSFEFWAKPTAVGTGLNVIDRFTTGGYFFSLDTSSRWRWYVRPTSGGDINSTVASPLAAVGRRQHIVGTFSAADGLRVYINGVQVGSLASNGFGLGGTALALKMFAASVSAASFAGTLDEIALYNDVLPAATILAHFKKGATTVATFELPYDTEAPSVVSVTATFALPYEASVNLAATAIAPLEANVALVDTDQQPYEASLGLAATTSVVYESRIGLALALAALPYEANIGVARLDSQPFEARIGIALLAALSYEANRAFASTTSLAYESRVILAPVLIGLAYESNVNLVTTASAAYESLISLAQTVSEPYEAGIGIQTTLASSPLEMLLGLVQTASTPYETQQKVNVATTVLLPYETSLGLVAVPAAIQFEALLGAQSTNSLWYEAFVQGYIIATHELSYESTAKLAVIAPLTVENVVGGIVQIVGVPYEAGVSAQRTILTPWETLYGLARTELMPWEISPAQPFTALYTLYYETVIPVALVTDLSAESIKPLAFTHALALEWLISCQASSQTLYETLVGIGALSLLPWESYAIGSFPGYWHTGHGAFALTGRLSIPSRNGVISGPRTGRISRPTTGKVTS